MTFLCNMIQNLIQASKQQEQQEPYYETLQSISFDGTKMFWLPVKPALDVKIDITFKSDNYASISCLLGGRINASGSNRKMFSFWQCVGGSSARPDDGYMRADLANSSTGTGDIGKSSSTSVWTNIVKDGNYNYLDGVLKATQSVTDEFYDDTNTYIALGCMSNGTESSYTLSNPFSGDVAQLKIWKAGTQVADYVPVLDDKMQPCLYNRTTKTFLYAKKISDNTTTYDLTYKRWNKFDVDYIESSGTQYINTGVYLTNNHSVEIDYQLTTTSNQSRTGIFGGLQSSGSTNINRYGTIISPSTQKLECGYGATNEYYQIGAIDTDRHVFKQEKNKIYFDGTLVKTFETATFTQNFTSPLGNFNFINYTPAKANYFGSKWWEGDTLIRDYKPTVWHNGNTTAVACLYDEVYNKMYTNAGSGSFKAYILSSTFSQLRSYTENNTHGYYISATGVVTAQSESDYSDAIPVNQGDIITLTVTTDSTNSNKRIHGYTTTNTNSWVQQIGVIAYSEAGQPTRTISVVVPSGISYIRISHSIYGETQCDLTITRTYEVGKSITNGQGAGYDLSVPYSNNFVFEAITTCKTTSSNYFMDTRKVISGGSATYQNNTGAFGIGGSSNGSTINWKDGGSDTNLVATNGTNWARPSGAFKYSAKLIGWEDGTNHKRTAVFNELLNGKVSDRVVTNGVDIATNRATVTLLYTTNSNVLTGGSELSYIYFAQDGVVEYDVIPVRNATITSEIAMFNRATNNTLPRLTISGSPTSSFNALD